MSNCHNVSLLNFVTFLGFRHTVCSFFCLFSKEMSKNRRNVTNITNLQPVQGMRFAGSTQRMVPTCSNPVVNSPIPSHPGTNIMHATFAQALRNCSFG